MAEPSPGRGDPDITVSHTGRSSVADTLSNREWNQLVDVVVERIEERVVDELTRRGRRFPGVF